MKGDNTQSYLIDFTSPPLAQEIVLAMEPLIDVTTIQ